MIGEDCFQLQNKANLRLRQVSMFVLAVLPLLAWYALPLPTGLGTTIVLFLSIYTIAKNNFNINVVPPTFLIVFVYVCVMWVYHNNFAIWTIIPPGGWVFFSFVLTLLWGVISFDFKFLKKYMFGVIMISAILFWIQLVLKLVYGYNVVCFVPNLTGSFTYENMSYIELVAKQMSEDRPCSIFMEPSHMAYYYVTYLAFVWFGKDFKEKWINKKIILILLTLVALRSGSGMVGLAVLIIVKFCKLFYQASINRKISLIFIMLPLVSATIFIYSRSDIGQEMLLRSEEFSTEGSSGYARVISGYVMFSQLDSVQQLIGIGDPFETFSIVRATDGSEHLYANGFQIVLLSLGYIGAGVYLIFYCNLYKKVKKSSKICIVLLLVLSLIEKNYLNSYMMLLTIVPCADYHFNQLQNKTK